MRSSLRALATILGSVVYTPSTSVKISQRCAPSAAASATAERSEPPRPSVVTRPSGAMPWKPGTTTTSPRSRQARSCSVPNERIRARPWLASVQSGACQPRIERAGTPSACSASARRPAVTCSPEATTMSYSARSWSRAADLPHPFDELVGRAGHRGDHDRDLLARDLCLLHTPCHRAQAIEIGHRSAAEFLHHKRHCADLPPHVAIATPTESTLLVAAFFRMASTYEPAQSEASVAAPRLERKERAWPNSACRARPIAAS